MIDFKLKIQIGRWTFQSASRLKKIILDGKREGRDKEQPHLYWMLVGIYDTRKFGFVLYRNGNLDQFY